MRFAMLPPVLADVSVARSLVGGNELPQVGFLLFERHVEVSHAFVEKRDLRHLLVGQLEIEDVHVVGDVRRARGLREDDVSLLDVPAGGRWKTSAERTRR